jgi:hypothetical protein
MHRLIRFVRDVRSAVDQILVNLFTIVADGNYLSSGFLVKFGGGCSRFLALLLIASGLLMENSSDFSVGGQPEVACMFRLHYVCYCHAGFEMDLITRSMQSAR